MHCTSSFPPLTLETPDDYNRVLPGRGGHSQLHWTIDEAWPPSFVDKSDYRAQTPQIFVVLSKPVSVHIQSWAGFRPASLCHVHRHAPEGAFVQWVQKLQFSIVFKLVLCYTSFRSELLVNQLAIVFFWGCCPVSIS